MIAQRTLLGKAMQEEVHSPRQRSFIPARFKFAWVIEEPSIESYAPLMQGDKQEVRLDQHSASSGAGQKNIAFQSAFQSAQLALSDFCVLFFLLLTMRQRMVQVCSSSFLARTSRSRVSRKGF